jgi:2-polyprenyl-6-methoxyphenol hydroxylase-like FAD-dependent oxidoreductase
LFVRSENSQYNSADVIVVGGGLAGVAAAGVLGTHGLRVTLVDARASCPAVFKAEKIEPDQAVVLRRLGLFEHLLPVARRIRDIRSCFNGRVFGIVSIEQYGASYSEMVNALRARLPEAVQFKLGRAVQISNNADLQRVALDSGEELTARLVVLACGLNAGLMAGLRLTRRSIQKHHSVAIAFTIARRDGRPFPFDSMTYYPAILDSGIDYLTLFPIGQTMRANLFAFPAADDLWVRKFVQDPEGELQTCFPKLDRVIGEYQVESRAETSLIHLYRTEGETPPGVVLIGDAAQNACPSTGRGLSKVFTDVDVLWRECVPRWFANDGMGSAKMNEFRNDARKRAVDDESLRSAIYRRQARTDRSPRWRLHRARLKLAMQLRTPGNAAGRPPREGEM